MPSHSGNWDGGSRTVYQAIQLSSGQRQQVNDTMSAPWDKSRQTPDKVIPLRPGFAVVECSIFLGKDMGPIFHIHPNDVSQFKLSGPVELDKIERIVLIGTAHFKSSYNGKNRFQMVCNELRWKNNRDANGHIDYDAKPALTLEQWDEAKARLIARKLLNRAGAITVAGRNAVGSQEF